MRAVPFSDEDKAGFPEGARLIVMGPPPDWHDVECGTTEVVRLDQITPGVGRPVTTHTTKWMPNADDLERLNAGESIYLQTIGEGMPPVWCGTDPWGTD